MLLDPLVASLTLLYSGTFTGLVPVEAQMVLRRSSCRGLNGSQEAHCRGGFSIRALFILVFVQCKVLSPPFSVCVHLI